MNQIEKIWEVVRQFVVEANNYGIPIPLLITLVFLFIFYSRINRWFGREKYYSELFKHLGGWMISLGDRLDYYQEPGSEYNDNIQSEHFKKLCDDGYAAFKNVREILPIARLFLSNQSIDALDNLISNHWYISEHGAINTQDYLSSTLKEVTLAYNQVLKNAKKDLKRSQYTSIFQKIQSDFK